MHIQVETYQQYYANAHAFLKALKNIGAYEPREHHSLLSAGVLRKIMRDFDLSHTYISYEIIYGSYIKK